MLSWGSLETGSRKRSLSCWGMPLEENYAEQSFLLSSFSLVDGASGFALANASGMMIGPNQRSQSAVG